MGNVAKDRTLGVPRGLLRFLVLKMLSERPMAGYEIVEQIEAQTNGRWKPSPGSVYPLLARMLKKGFTTLSGSEAGLKRYSFTLAGRRFFEQQVRRNQDFMRKLEFLMPLLVGGLQLGPNQEKRAKIHESARRLLQTFLAITNNLERLSEQDANEIADALKDCSEKLGEIAQTSEADTA